MQFPSTVWIGGKGRDISNTGALTEDQAKLLKTYYDGFTAYTTPKANSIFARYKFHKKMQDSGESFKHFVTELRLLVKDCPREPMADHINGLVYLELLRTT